MEGARLWKDRPVVVFFFASWCSRCATQQEALAPLAEKYRDVVTFVGVGGQDKAPRREVLAGRPRRHATRSGSTAASQTWRRYAVRQPPAVILVAPGGKLERGWPGGVSTDVLAGQLERLVRR